MFKAVFVVFVTFFVGSIHANKIIGGYPVDITERPFQVSLRYFGAHTCGGSLINNTWVLTAAHCTENPASSYSVRLGSTSRTSGGTIINVANIINHPLYGTDGFSYDISLLQLAQPVTFSASISSIQLSTTDVPDGDEMIVSGWGTTSSGLSASDLQAAAVPKVSQQACVNAYGSSVTETMICAGITGKDSCQGDSGGPLTYEDVLVGIISWGRGCAITGYPGVYTKVSYFNSWINGTTK